jgi:uncharacterized protein (UPF0333 family)
MLGQAALEYLMMLSIVLVILSILVYYTQVMTEGNREDIATSNALIAVNKVAEAANIVYTQGDSSEITLSVYVPESVYSINFTSNTIIMKVGRGPYDDIFAMSKANFTPDSMISSTSGTKRVRITNVKNQTTGFTYVNVTEG